VGANRIERRLCPGRMGALEKLLRGFAERDGEDVVKPGLGITFDSLMGAYDFYNFYTKFPLYLVQIFLFTTWASQYDPYGVSALLGSNIFIRSLIYFS